MKKYEFTQDCIIGIEAIDEEHAMLFQIINAAIELSNESDAAKTVIIQDLIRKLGSYAATHFQHEESYMESIGDPELPRQKREHQMFINKVEELGNLKEGEYNASDKFEDITKYLVKWLYSHIIGSDMMIGKIPSKSANQFNKSLEIQFTSQYVTGIELVDEEHKQLFKIINDVNAAINAEFVHDKYDKIMNLLAQLREYTELHFADEEKIMEEMGYPGYEAQKRAHDAFIEKLVTMSQSDIEKIDDNQDEYLLELIEFLKNWLINHILKMDKLIGEFV